MSVQRYKGTVPVSDICSIEWGLCNLDEEICNLVLMAFPSIRAVLLDALMNA